MKCLCEPIRLYIPTINDKSKDFEELFKLWDVAKDVSSDIIFDFSKCDFLRPNAIAFLGGLARLVESQNYSAVFDWDTLKK